jgi:Raf kinase inhibitor-like YbhB/YbcL family protein
MSPSTPGRTPARRRGPRMGAWAVAGLLLAGLVVASARGAWGEMGGTMGLSITSEAFEAGGEIPRKYTCDGEDLAPPLAIDGIPDGVRSLALIVDDPDAPDPAAPQRVFVHWVLYDLPPAATALPEGPGEAPAGARAGTNDWGRTRYGGPCPPIGRHRYFFKLYALDMALGDLEAPTKARLLEAMEGHVVARTELMGTYRRGR